MEDRHEQFMKRCIDLGMKAKSNGVSPVGSVVVKNGNIIAEGYEGEKEIPQPVAHAEMIALIKAIQHLGTKDLGHCILYTTKEPCFMCSYLIRQTGIKEVVFAMRTEDKGGISSRYPILSAVDINKWPAPPNIVEGILKETCEQNLK
ncbi:MAG: nucleoside deaminase [Bacteroidetes bacterium]|nr:nucleoside deaminase [Bacteroidota bacterium]